MAVADDEIRQVRAQTDLVALVGEHVALRKQGQRFVGLCPFHQERTPSFSVNAEEGVYYCFGCQKSGDAITFVRETQHLDFLDALRLLADRAGIELHEDGARTEGGWRDRAALYEAMARAVDWYHERLLAGKDAGRARDYLRSRGYDKETVTQFRLGWAPDDWDALVVACKLPAELAAASGLGFVNRAGRLQDALRGRVLFPICDPGGRPVALGGRILPGTDASAGGRPEPKYKNTQETAIYQKRKTLYALNWAKQDVIAAGEVVVCEGYTDVIACFRAGVPRAVATCGTALAEDHFRLLRNFASRVVLAYDQDQAGQHGAEAVYQWERTHEVQVAVARLPEGLDPAELERTDRDALPAAIRDAVPYLQFRLDRALAGADTSTPEGRARAADRALAVVAEHPNDLVRDQYLMQVAEQCGLSPELLRQRLARRDAGPARAPEPAASRAPRASEAREDRPGAEALRLALHLGDGAQARLRPLLFEDPLQRRAFELLEARSAQAAIDAAESAGEADAAQLLRRLLVEDPDVPPAGDPLTPVVAQLVRRAAQRVLMARQRGVRDGLLDHREVMAEVAAARELLERLEGPDGIDAERELVEWLEAEESGDVAA